MVTRSKLNPGHQSLQPSLSKLIPLPDPSPVPVVNSRSRRFGNEIKYQIRITGIIVLSMLSLPFLGVVHCGTSIIHKCSSHPPLPHLINTTAVSYGSSGMDQIQHSTHFNVHVSWSDNAPGLTASLPLIHQGNHWAPEGYQDPGQQLWDHRDRTHSIPQGIVPQVPEAPSHSTALMCAPQHDLNYTSLLDDLLDVLQSDLAAHNNIVAPHFLTNVQNSTVSLPQPVNPVM